MKIADLKDKKIGILGLGVEGLSLYQKLKNEVKNIAVFDQYTEEELVSKSEPENLDLIKNILEDPKTVKFLGPEYLKNIGDIDVLFRSPGISYLNPEIVAAKERGAIISSQIKLFIENCPAQIVSVTGTKGKGTTATLIKELLVRGLGRKIYLAGNIGLPAITLLDETTPDDIVVLELSSFQLMDLEISPSVAVVTNLYEEHLDYHNDDNEYIQAKYNIIAHQNPDDIAILNINSTFPKEMLSGSKSQKQYFSKDENKKCRAYIRQNNDKIAEVILVLNQEVIICNQKGIKLLGRHNLENIAAAALVADNFGIKPKLIKSVVSEFRGLPHRLELVAIKDDITYIDDSFGTNPGPAIAAIKAFSEDKILILGGSSKSADFTEMAKEITGTNVVGVVLVGDEGSKIGDTLVKNGFAGSAIEGGNDMVSIVQNAKKIAKSGQVVILSPACASFGLFKNYKDRGEQFKKAVENL
ncbi:MAG: UDP-N-acetylmuramoyl-L-alanine--D-glutamate ligase [Patescibacteria group bacterium]